MSLLKIFSDRKYLVEGQPHVVMLYPFWGKNTEDPRDPSSGRYDRYAEVGSSFFQMVPLEETDVAVLPVDWGGTLNREASKNLALRFAEMAKQAGKPTLIFFWNDSDQPVPIDNSVVFRTSFYRSSRKYNEFAHPSWSEDFVERYLGGQIPLRPKRDKPVVGFCGLAAPTIASFKLTKRDILRLGGRLLRGKSMGPPLHLLRTRVMQILSRSRLVKTNFVIREHFWGGSLLSDGTKDFETLQRVRREYVRNMVDSDYIICVRGTGNFSYRLYETLSCSRIPIFIDTDCVLPYDWLINWKQYSVWVDENDVSKVAEKVAAFHQALSPRDFHDLQISCRKLWEDWLSPKGFFENLHLHFEK